MKPLKPHANVTPSDTSPLKKAGPLKKVGFGVSGPLGARWFSNTHVQHLLENAIASGIHHFDTAPFYGNGLAEARLGKALASHRQTPMTVSTKTGTQFDKTGRVRKDFSKDAIRADIESSLQRLNIPHLDIVYLHGPDKANTIDGLEYLRALRAEGLCRRIGVCSEGPLIDLAIKEGADAIMARFNFLNHTHRAVFETAQQKGVHITAISPLAQALYSNNFAKAKGLSDLWRIARALLKNRSDLIAARRLRRHVKHTPISVLKNHTITQAALQYVLDTPFVDIGCFTTSKPAHLETAIAAARTPLTQEQRCYLDELRINALAAEQ